LIRFFVGRDSPPGEVIDPASGAIGDPFIDLVIARGEFPTTLNELLAVLDRSNGQPEGLPDQLSFLVGEGAQIPWSAATSHIDRAFRFAVARGRGSKFPLFISTAAPFDDDRIFLQLIAWDATAGAFQFYERRSGSWIWAGSSWQALEEDTRGQGPFDSHINGGMVMKELEQPWLHWHSMAQTIGEQTLAPDDPLRAEPLFTNRDGAERLEMIVRTNMSTWVQSRLGKAVAPDGSIDRPDRLMRQVLTTTAPTIASSIDPYDGDPQATIQVPLTFFLDRVGLFDIAELELNPGFTVERSRYRVMAQHLGLAVRDTRAQPPVRIDGDTFFAWPVPEPGLEDSALLKALVRKGIISRRFAAALLMIDFPNPVGSDDRAKLMAYVPSSADASGSNNIETQLLATLGQASAWPQGSPERQLVENMQLADGAWPAEYQRRLSDYVAAATARLATDQGLHDFMLLADSRRREFRRRPIAEFNMTLPWIDIDQDVPFLKMTPLAEVVAKT
jgi:hypothetical protein